MDGLGISRSFGFGDGVFRVVAICVAAILGAVAAYASLGDASSVQSSEISSAILADDSPKYSTPPESDPTRHLGERTADARVPGGGSDDADTPPGIPENSNRSGQFFSRPSPGEHVALSKLCAENWDPDHHRCSSASKPGFRAAYVASTSDDADIGKTIAGRILGEDGLGIEGVKVIVVGTGPARHAESPDAGKPIRSTTATVPGGHYAFENLPDGDYRIQTTNHGEYRSAWMSVRAGLMRADLVLVRDGRMVVRGQVVDEDEEPLEGVMVLPNMVGVPSTATGSNGRYRLAIPLKPGATHVRVSFRSPGYLEKTLSIPATTTDEYEGPEFDVAMDFVESWTSVTGTVSEPDGDALPGRTVQLHALGRKESYSVTTDAEGEFDFHAVEAGLDYQLRVGGGRGFPDYTRHVRVRVEDSDFDVVLEPFEFAEVSGRLVNLEGAPIPDFNLALRNAASRSPNAIVRSDSDGNFTIERAPAGDILFATRSSPSMVVRGVTLEAGDELHVPLVLDWGEHEIRGVLVDRTGSPVPGSGISLTWSHESDGIHSSSIRRTTSDAQGFFTFSALGPGPHRLQVDSPGRPTLALNYDSSREGYDLTLRMN